MLENLIDFIWIDKVDDVIVIVDRKLTPMEAAELFFKLEEEKETLIGYILVVWDTKKNLYVLQDKILR